MPRRTRPRDAFSPRPSEKRRQVLPLLVLSVSLFFWPAKKIRLYFGVARWPETKAMLRKAGRGGGEENPHSSPAASPPPVPIPSSTTLNPTLRAVDPVMASASGGGAAAPPVAVPGGGGGEAGPDAPLSERWDALRASEAAARAARAVAELALNNPSRPVPPALPRDAWEVIMDRAASCRCAGESAAHASDNALGGVSPLHKGATLCGSFHTGRVCLLEGMSHPSPAAHPPFASSVRIGLQMEAGTPFKGRFHYG